MIPNNYIFWEGGNKLSIISMLINKYKITMNPVKYWREQGAKIGEHCEIYSTSNLGSEPYLISIGNHVRINDRVNLITHDGGLWVVRELYPELSKADLIKPIVIGNNVHIGTGAVIMPGVHIGDNCIIGVGAVVTKDIPDNSIAVGVPARVIETIDEYVQKNKDKYINTKGLSADKKKEIVLKAMEE